METWCAAVSGVARVRYNWVSEQQQQSRPSHLHTDQGKVLAGVVIGMMRPEKNAIEGKQFQKKESKVTCGWIASTPCRPGERPTAPDSMASWHLGLWSAGCTGWVSGHNHVDPRVPGAHPGSQVTARGLSASPEIPPTASAWLRVRWLL